MASPLAYIINPALNSLVGNVMTRSSGTTLQMYLSNFITLAISAAGVFFFGNLLFGGIQYIFAGGDKEAVQRAQKRITNALIGIVIVLSVFAITFVVEVLFGISILNFTIPAPS